MEPLNIEIYSDLICPWCYIGRRRLQLALDQLAMAAAPSIRWQPFQLNPDMPKEGKERSAYRAAKFGSLARSQAMDRDVAAVGAEIGLEFNFDRVRVTPNTFDGHRLLWWAKDSGRQDQLSDALFHGYFTEGLDIGRGDILVALAARVGLAPDEAMSFLVGDDGAAEVRGEEERGRTFGINGVPFFVLNRRPILSGAHPPDVFVRILREIAAD